MLQVCQSQAILNLLLHFLKLLITRLPLGHEMGRVLFINLCMFQFIFISLQNRRNFFCVSEASAARERDSREGRSLARRASIPRTLIMVPTSFNLLLK